MCFQQRTVLHAYIRAIVCDAHLAEDVFQEVAVLVVQKAAEVRSPEHLMGWLRRAARYQALDQLRRRKRERDLVCDPEILDRLEAQWQCYDHEEPELWLQALRRCLLALPETARELVGRRYQDDWTVEVEATATGRSCNAIYQQLGRIHHRLAACFRRGLGGRTGA